MERYSRNSLLRIPELPEEAPGIAFDDLLQELKNEGFSLTLHDHIEFTAIFQQYTGTRAAFKYYLAPIVCRNREEQEKFYRIYDRFYTSPPDPRAEAARGIQKQFGIFRNFYLRLFLFLFLSGGGKAIQLLWHYRHREKLVVIVPTTPVSPDSTVATAPSPAKHGPVFVVKPMRSPVADSGEAKSAVVPLGRPIEKENSIHPTAFAWLLILGGTCLILSASFFPQRKSKYLPEVDLDNKQGDGVSLDIPFLPKDHLIQKLPAMTKVVGDLRLPVPTGIYRLDIVRTIRESIRSYGLLLPVYNDVERKPEYLVLIDRSSELSFDLARYVLQLFINERVSINYYYYREEGVFYSEGAVDAIGVYDLWERHGNAGLILMDGGNDWPAGTSQWEDRLVMTDLLGYSGKDGIVHIGDTARLRWYLGDDDLFQWVCAAAIYPSLKWEVLIAVGDAVLGARGVKDKLNYTNLLKVIRIDWFRGNVIPAAKRVELLKSLDVDAEIEARKALLTLLKESDGIINSGTAVYEEMLLQRYTQSFVLYANDVKKKEYEDDAKKFMSLWNKKRVPDMSTVIYLRNQNKEWETPLRSTENADSRVGAARFMNELLALRVISDPRIRAFFRNAAVGFFMILLLLYLFKDNMVGWGGNKTVGFIERDYRDNAITVMIPVNDCLRKQADNGKLKVTLNNYDNNLYMQTYSLAGIDTDTLRVRFEDITMAGKPPDKASFTLILDKDLRIECKYTAFYSQYLLLLKGEDCARSRFKPGPPNYYGREGHVDQQ